MKEIEINIAMKYCINKINKIIDDHLINITETKINHLLLSDSSEYHKQQFLIEKYKEDLLEEIKEQIYNLK